MTKEELYLEMEQLKLEKKGADPRRKAEISVRMDDIKAMIKAVNSPLKPPPPAPKAQDAPASTAAAGEFWTVTVGPTGTRVRLSLTDISRHLLGEGYMKYDRKDYVHIGPDGCVKPVDIADIKKHLVRYMRKNEPEAGFHEVIDERIRREADSLKETKLRDFMEPFQFHGLRDTATERYAVYRNGILRSTASGSVLLPFDRAKHMFWEEEVLPRDYVEVPAEEYQSCDFSRFVGMLFPTPERFESAKSAFGYLLTNYKNPSHSPAVVTTDEGDTLERQGRTGKGLIGKVLDKYVSRLYIDCSKFDRGSPFSLQALEPHHRLIHFDEAKAEFIEPLLSEITEGVIVEKKYGGQKRIAHEYSPKYYISTNYVQDGAGASYTDRIFTLEVSHHFSPEHRPQDEFGRPFISGWDDAEWHRCDAFMNECVRVYMQHGLLPVAYSTDYQRKTLRQLTRNDFPEWCDSHIVPGRNIWTSDIKKWWESDFSKSKCSNQQLYDWIRQYAKYMGWTVLEDLKKPTRNPLDGNTERFFLFRDEATWREEKHVSGLEKLLHKAVEEQRYEDAARVRDDIERLKNAFDAREEMNLNTEDDSNTDTAV